MVVAVADEAAVVELGSIGLYSRLRMYRRPLIVRKDWLIGRRVENSNAYPNMKYASHKSDHSNKFDCSTWAQPPMLSVQKRSIVLLESLPTESPRSINFIPHAMVSLGPNSGYDDTMTA